MILAATLANKKMPSKILLSHPVGNANVKQAALAFVEADMLEEFWTSISWGEQSWANAVLPKSIKKELMRRGYHQSVLEITKHYPWYEIVRLVAPKFGLGHLVATENGWFSTNHCHEVLDTKVARRIGAFPGLSVVYAYDHCAMESFKTARSIGAKCIYDLPIAYWRLLQKIILEEIELQPGWRGTAPSIHFPREVFDRKDEELMLADHVVVASQFTKKSLQLLSQMHAPVTVIPYGAPQPVAFHRVNQSRQRKLRVLYVGRLGLAKGLPYLLDATSQLGGMVELTLIGAHGGASVALDAALNMHKWIPSLSNQDILAEMDRHDVFVFPSLCDGFGLVILEALSRGLPVITTPHTGGPDVLTEGEDGFIVPIRSSAAIVEKLELLIEDRELLARMSNAALHKAAACSWEEYRGRLVEMVCHTIEGKT